MKNNLFITLMITMVIFMVSCTKDAENPAPSISSITASGNEVTLTFSEGVYSKSDGTGALTDANINITIPNVDFTSAVAHTAGSKTVVLTLDYVSIVPENTEITITTASSIYDDKGVALSSGKSVSTQLDADLGIIGKWYSSGDNVAPLLVTYFLVDSIYAEFGDDYSLLVHQFSNGNTSGIPDVIFNGTFTLERSNVEGIWNIVVAQSLPYAADVVGIFQVKADPEVLWYEVVQVSGTQNVPPTAEAGFGSSNGGTLGEANIQKFIRIP